jgi:asparagine synthase (glutamine-hydrolysing)
MCGIAGKVSLDGPIDRRTIENMTDALRHRGPDDGDVWIGDGAALGSRRLAIIDLSPRGRMPMTNEDGSLRLVFNGEIYNFEELRRDLEKRGHAFHSDTDSETLVHLYEEEGIAAITRLRGMFAFAMWDASRRRLWLGRDRLGKKPLFYRLHARELTFASEVRAFMRDPAVDARPDLTAIDRYLTWGAIPAPSSAIAGIQKVPPAHHLVFEGGRVSLERYWKLSYVPKRLESEPELREELRRLIETAVRLRMISDVPLGALLSGGVDSSVVVAAMRRVTSGPIRTFSIGFDRSEYDEIEYARQVARRFETEHHELVIRPDASDWLQKVAHAYSEPFADSSALPSLALCAMARQTVTVALSGDGGDESFMGYDRHRAMRLAELAARLPGAARGAAGRLAGLLRVTRTKSTVARARRFGETLAFDPVTQYTHWLTCATPEVKRELYGPALEATLESRAEDDLREAFEGSDAASLPERAAHADLQRYLPDDLLVKMDIASMAHGLEVRSPLLDHHVVEFAASLPAELKLRGRVQKYLLKEAFREELPNEIRSRKKMGFGVPVDHWLRHELRSQAYEILLDDRSVRRGYFRKAAVQRLLDEHSAARANHQFVLWALLMLELWHTNFIDVPQPIVATSVA